MEKQNNIPLLAEVLIEYEMGTLDMTKMARKCYLSEREKAAGRIAWVHNNELNSHIILKKIAGDNMKDILKNTKLL